MNKDYSKSYLISVSDLGLFEFTARKYKNDAISLKNNDLGSCTPSFHLLSSLAFELFPKVLIGYDICIKYGNDETVTEEKIKEEISNEMRRYNHKLDKLYINFPDLLKYLDIQDIVEFKNGYVWDYRVTKTDGKIILIKDVEAIRYGSFAKNSDIMTHCLDDGIIIDLLNKLEKYVEIKKQETFKKLNTSI